MQLFAELKRRKVFRIGAAYLVVAWLIVQAASIGFPAFDAPPWVLRVFTRYGPPDLCKKNAAGDYVCE